MRARYGIILWLLATEIYAGPLFGDISWTDKNLQSCVEQQAQEHGWQDVSEVTELQCHNTGIESADELQLFTGLTQLSLFNNNLTKLDLRPLKKLQLLNLANNDLTELQIVGLNQLETLYLFRNKLRTLDLSGLTAVKKIRLMQNRLTKLDITPLTSLETGYLFDNKLEDLQITGLNKLTFLDVRQNPMPDELYDFYDEQQGIMISHDGNADDWQ